MAPIVVIPLCRCEGLMRYEVARHLLRPFFGPRRSTAWLWTQCSWRHHTCQELRTRTVDLRQLSAMVEASVIVYSLSNECHHSKCYCRTVLDTALSVQFLPGRRNASYSFRMVTTILVDDTVSTACSSSCTGVSFRSSCAPLRAMEDFHLMKRRQRCCPCLQRLCNLDEAFRHVGSCCSCCESRAGGRQVGRG